MMAAQTNPFGDIAHTGASHDRLGFAFCLVLALHAAFILGVSFTQQERSPAASKLEITLAQHKSQQAPAQADFLAQNNQQGSGTLNEKAMLTSREMANFQDTMIREVAQQQMQTTRQAKLAATSRLTTTNYNITKINTQQHQQKSIDPSELLNQELAIIQRNLEIASLEAKLDIQQQAYANRPRIRRLTSVATKQSDDALYLHNWRSKVETIGNQHYPSTAKQQQLYGDLRMVVSLLPNGDVLQIKILQSSGYKILDQAAINIVHLAAPYDPFPQTMLKNVDVLEIIRTWRFHKDKLSSRT